MDLTLKWAGSEAGPKSILSSSSSEGQDTTRSVKFALLVCCQEVSGREYDEQICVTLLHPLGAEIAEVEKAKLFMAQYYKVVKTVSTNEEWSIIGMAIFDAGAGTNVIWEDVLLTTWMADIQLIRAIVKSRQ